jgi:precorrin-6B methylase 2
MIPQIPEEILSLKSESRPAAATAKTKTALGHLEFLSSRTPCDIVFCESKGLPMKKFIRPIVFLIAILVSTFGLLAQERILDVPYVPTKFPVVDEMLKMAGVTKTDVLYDLGCGDGRIVIGAAQKYGARGVGIDLDPERIHESEANAKSAGVADRVKFMTGDLFETDFREASVVSLYLLTSVNLKLRPRLLRELQPGTRVVSHNFGMENWKPDASSEVDVDGIRHDVYFWIIPANASGSWSWTMNLNGKTVETRTTLTQKYQYATGSAKINGIEAEVRDTKIQGNFVRFTIEIPVEGKSVPFVFEGKVLGHTINGSIRATINGQTQAWTWKATRNPATEKPIDEAPSEY